MKKIIKSVVVVFACIMAALGLQACYDIQLVETTTTDVNLYSYLRKYPEKFSDFASILDKAGYNSFLDAYGAYTVFAPTNTGVQTYLKGINKTIEQLTVDEAQNIAKIHIIRDTLTTKSFKDGKLPLVTMYGQYLLGGVTYENGASSYSVNRQASVLESNIFAGNGILHVINNMLKPANQSLANLLESNPDYSIFTEAVRQTGYYDSLNYVNPNLDLRWTTVLAETNDALKKAGFATFDALKKRYSNTGNPRNKTDSLNLYVSYHLLPGAKYLADIISATSHLTKVPLEVVTSKLDDQTVLINDIDFNGVHEQGVILERPKSDNSATNGVLHSASSHFNIKIRKPTPVHWKVADFSEIRKLPAYFRKKNYDFAIGAIADMTWEKNTITYVYNVTGYYRDYLQVPLGIGNAARSNWIEMKTPLIVKGRYKVWVCYRQQKQSGGSVNVVQAYFDGDPLTRPVTFTDTAPSGTAGELESLGWKIYIDQGSSISAGRMLGIIDVKTTDRHLIRFQSISGGQNTNNFDLIQFIPVDMNQLSPRFTLDGLMVP
ncbi:MAG: fasciclin domain-containing protein [Spirosomataceae bacterium]